MWRKAEPSLLWDSTSSQPIEALKQFEKEDLFLETMDCLDYAEEKLLELEYAPQNMAGIRRLQSTCVRLYELTWTLQLWDAFKLIQNARALLSYARQGSICIERSDISKLFTLLSVLKKSIQQYNQEPFLYKRTHIHTPLPSTAEAHRQSEGWLLEQLYNVEKMQESYVQHTGKDVRSAPFVATQLQPTGEHTTEGSSSRSNGAVEHIQECQSLASELKHQIHALQTGLQASSTQDATLHTHIESLFSLQKALSSKLEHYAQDTQPSSSLFGLVVRLQEHSFIFPTSCIGPLFPAESIQIEEHSSGALRGTTPQGECFPLHSLADFLPRPETSKTGEFESFSAQASSSHPQSMQASSASARPFVVLVQTSTGPRMLWVEQIVREMMIELLSVHTAHEECAWIRGSGRLPDGQSVWLFETDYIPEKEPTH